MLPWRKLAHWEIPPAAPCGNCHENAWDHYENGNPESPVMSFNNARECCVPEILETVKREAAFTSARFESVQFSDRSWVRILEAIRASHHKFADVTLRCSNIDRTIACAVVDAFFTPSLRRIDVSFCKIGLGGVGYMKRFYSDCPALRHFEADGVEIPQDDREER